LEVEVEVEELRAELLLWALLLEEEEEAAPPVLDTDQVLTVMPPPAVHAGASSSMLCIRGRPCCCGCCMLVAALVVGQLLGRQQLYLPASKLLDGAFLCAGCQLAGLRADACICYPDSMCEGLGEGRDLLQRHPMSKS
jgi:hypothetical protein